MTCGAPLFRLPGKKQALDVYWRGKRYRRIIFRENGDYSLQVEDASPSEGFLEFRVRPAFNLKMMGLGAESRDLGVQVSTWTVNWNVDVNEERIEGKFVYRYLSGWIYVSGQETRGQKVFIQFEKPDGTVVRHPTMPEERPDVGAFIKNALYDASGFSALIPLKNGSDITACTIRFVVENKNGRYVSSEWKPGIR